MNLITRFVGWLLVIAKFNAASVSGELLLNKSE